VKGAIASANLFSIVETAKANGAEPHAAGRRVARSRETPTCDSPWLNEPARLIEGVSPIEGEWIEGV
jgi:hypothetical protein